jgi:formate-dependent nitrite reductase cytochrome c552 subunit
VRIVDPGPWLKRQRDDRLRELQTELDAGADPRAIRAEMRRVRRDYRRAQLGRAFGPRW